MSSGLGGIVGWSQLDQRERFGASVIGSGMAPVLDMMRKCARSALVSMAALSWSQPHVGTSPIIVDLRATEPAGAARDHGAPSGRTPTRAAAQHTQAAASLPATAGEQAREVLAALSLNRSQLAEVLRVTRPSLYSWLSGAEPNETNRERLALLVGILQDAGITSQSPLNARVLRREDKDGRTLLDFLRAARWDRPRIVAALRGAATQTKALDQKRLDREARLAALGYEQVDAEERRRRLAQNIAQRDWPKP